MAHPVPPGIEMRNALQWLTELDHHLMDRYAQLKQAQRQGYQSLVHLSAEPPFRLVPLRKDVDDLSDSLQGLYPRTAEDPAEFVLEDIRFTPVEQQLRAWAAIAERGQLPPGTLERQAMFEAANNDGLGMYVEFIPRADSKLKPTASVIGAAPEALVGFTDAGSMDDLELTSTVTNVDEALADTVKNMLFRLKHYTAIEMVAYIAAQAQRKGQERKAKIFFDESKLSGLADACWTQDGGALYENPAQQRQLALKLGQSLAFFRQDPAKVRLMTAALEEFYPEKAVHLARHLGLEDEAMDGPIAELDAQQEVPFSSQKVARSPMVATLWHRALITAARLGMLEEMEQAKGGGDAER